MSTLSYRNARFRLQFARQATTALLDDLPADGWLHQPIPGANHALWITGHLAINDDRFLSRLADRPPILEAGWRQAFGAGTQPVPTADTYPSPEETRRGFDDVREKLLEWYETLDDTTLASLLPEDLQRFAPNHVELLSSLAWHEGWHGGQLSVIRRSLGFPSRFG